MRIFSASNIRRWLREPVTVSELLFWILVLMLVWAVVLLTLAVCDRLDRMDAMERMDSPRSVHDASV